jgi:hypothetical protein
MAKTSSSAIRKHRPATASTMRGRPRTPRARRPVQHHPVVRRRLSRRSLYTIVSVLVVVVLAALTTVPRPSKAVLNLVSPALAPDEKYAPQSTVNILAAVPLKSMVANSERKGVRATQPATLPESANILDDNGQVQVLDLCNEYSGYCADESWPLVMALEKFGTFNTLGYVTARGGTYSGTVGLDFYLSSYSSKYIAFAGVEMYTTQRQVLQSPDSVQETILDNWDVPPYAPKAQDIPFIDFGGDYYMTGPGFDGAKLADLGSTPAAGLKATATELAAGVAPISWVVQDQAAHMIGTICLATRNVAPVCHGLPTSLERPTKVAAFNNELAPPTTTTTAKSTTTTTGTSSTT